MKHGTLTAYCNKKYLCRCVECRAAFAAYMRKRRKDRPDVRARDLIVSKRSVEKVKQFVRSQKEGKPCVDCNTVYPYYVLQFDHRGDDPKMFMLSNAPSIEKAKVEILKCDLVCANCHAARTYIRRLTLLKRKVKL